MTDLADEIERRVRDIGRSPRPENDATSLGFWVAGQLQSLLTALRASRPEPTADAVEAVARALCEKSLHPRVCPCKGREFRCDDEHPGVMARAALSALPRPEADEGAVRKADEIFDDITRGGPTVDAVMREDWATVAEWMRQRAEDGLAVTRAALAAAQEGSKT